MNNFSKKIFSLLIFLNFIITSCAQNPNIVPSTYTTLFTLLENRFFGDEEGLSAEVIADIPYASSLVNFNNSKKSLLILQSKEDDIYTWVSSDNKIFLTHKGRITGTIGLQNDLYKINRPDISFKELLKKTGLTKYIAYYSFRKPTLNNLRVEVTVRVLGEDKIDLLGQERNLILIEERLVSKKINWKRTDRYWVDKETHYVWKSEQSISPKLPVLTFQVTKKPAM